MFSSFQHQLHQLVQRGLDNHLRLAVTGLSRSGKTAFITSLVDQLLHISPHMSNAHLPLFMPARQHLICEVKRVRQNDATLTRFDYEGNREYLESEPPQWCPSTVGMGEIRLAIRYQRTDALRYLKEHSTLYLDILDYPGEWLLDLPMLDQDFKTWSLNQQRVHTGERATLAMPWLAQVKTLDLTAPTNEGQLAKISENYTAYLLACKANGMQYIQPGRFVLPDENKGSLLYQFFPLLNLSEVEWQRLENSPKDSAFHELKKRYGEYKQFVIKPFYENYFSQFDRQVILADCLTPLNHSRQAFLEMKLGLQQLFQHFHYGERSLFHRLFSSRIDKLLFLATKADHITSDQLPNLESILRQLVQEEGKYAKFGNITTAYQAISAVCATDAVKVKQNGQTFCAIRGVRSSDKKLTTLYAGSVPNRLPDENFWQTKVFDFETFEPKPLKSGEPIPHLKMDAVLQFLLGDWFN